MAFTISSAYELLPSSLRLAFNGLTGEGNLSLPGVGDVDNELEGEGNSEEGRLITNEGEVGGEMLGGETLGGEEEGG